MKNNNIDPFQLEVMRNQMISIVSEMTETLKRAAYTPTIYEVLDFSIAIHDKEGNVIAQDVGIPIFLGAMSTTVKVVADTIGIDNFCEGDVIVCNDPYLAGGTHVNDVNIISPVIYQGEIMAFLNCKAHWRDIGGKDPGSWSADATDIFQEGLRLPPLKLVREGNWNNELLEVILANNRLRENALGDLKAQVASCYIGEIRMKELLDKYGKELYLSCAQEILDHGERMMQAEIKEIPNGEYTSYGYVDSDGISEKGVRVALTITVKDEEIIADLSESDPEQQGGSGNTIYAGTLSAVRLAVKSLTDPNLPTNEGSYRPIKVIAPKGTCVNAEPPSPVTVGLGSVNLVTIECVYQALKEAIPNRVIGQIYGGINALQIAGNDPNSGNQFIYGAPHSGGWGARSDKDGINGMMTIINGDCRNIPAEIIEAKYPIRVEQYSLISDSGGAGRFRGGLGIRADYKVLVDDAVFATALIKYRISPKGVFGGKPGKSNQTILNPGSKDEKKYFRVAGKPIEKGDVLSHQMGGGGGYGDPLERDINMVLQDVINGYISVNAALRDYGVVIENNKINDEETKKIRRGRKGEYHENRIN